MNTKTDQSGTSPHRILVVGGGFGGVYALRALHRQFHNDPRVSFHLVSPTNYFLFTPLLHEVATGASTPESVVESLRKIVGCCLKDFHIGKVANVDLAGHKVSLISGDVIPYDTLILSAGAQTNFFGVAGAKEHAFPLKTLEEARALKNHILRTVERAAGLPPGSERKRLLSFVVVGGGPTGVEFAAELAELCGETFWRLYSDKDYLQDVSISILERGEDLLGKFANELRTTAARVLTRRGVAICTGMTVTAVTPDKVKLADGGEIETATVVWVAGVTPQAIELVPDVPRAKDGRILVENTLELADHPEVFVIGDLAAAQNPNQAQVHPMLAQVAIKEAEIVAQNIILRFKSHPPRRFIYRSSGTLVSLGGSMAAGDIAGFTVSGRFMWWVWRTVYITKLISWTKKFQVALNWTITLFLPRDVSEI